MNDAELKASLGQQRRWLITGVAGFIGSSLLEYLLQHNQIVVGVDNFLTGFKENIEEVLESCTNTQKANFTFYEGDIGEFSTCLNITNDIDIILHQAALGSVPRSIEHPNLTHESNVNGMFNLLMAAKESNIQAFVYASSSSVYGDSEKLPKREDCLGSPLSPYAASKYIDEIYADVFARCYDLRIVGIRYFNVFGPRQSEDGPYSAIIPTWISRLLSGQEVYVNGDGSTSRDFTYITNVVRMNMLAALKAIGTSGHKVYNAGAGGRITLLELFELISEHIPGATRQKLKFRDFRIGDVRHSFADISLAGTELGYFPTSSTTDGIALTVKWFEQKLKRAS